MKLIRVRSKLKWIIASGVVLAVGAAWAWWQMGQPKLEARVYRIGFSNQPPQHYVRPDGQPAGLAVELINEAARRRGIHLSGRLNPKAQRPLSRARKSICGLLMTIRPERKNIVYITEAFREDTICFLVRSKSSFIRFRDFENSTIAFDG